MKKSILLSLAIALLSSIAMYSCKKSSDNNNSTAVSTTWTFNGTSYTADSIDAGIDTIIGGTGLTELTAYRGGNIAVYVRLHAHTTGTYGSSSLEVRYPDSNNLLSSASVTITRISNNQIDGTFDGFYNGNEVKGTFKNVHFTYF